MIKPLLDIGKIGLIKDQDPYNLPESAITESKNVRFADGNAEKMYGHSDVYTGLSVAPYWVHPAPTSSDYFWIYAGLQHVYATEGTGHYKITPITATATDIPFTGAAGDIWNGGKISGIPVFTNGVEAPVRWDPVASSTKLTYLPWDSGNTWRASTKSCKVIRPFREFLVALNMTEGGTAYPKRLRWSTSAASGAVPTTWDDTDTAEDAGYTEFLESAGDLVDCGPMRHLNVIYTETNSYAMSYVGGNDIFTFDNMFNVGCLATRCFTEFLGRHLVLTSGDVVVHDGSSIESIVSKRMQKWLFSQIDATNYGKSYVVPYYKQNEIWICFPISGSTFPDYALIWNYVENTFQVRELPNAAFIGYGIVDPGENTTFDTDTGAIDSDTGAFDERSYNPTQYSLLVADPTNTKVYKIDETDQFNGSNMTSYFQREGLDFGTSQIKRVKRIYPRITSTSSVTISVGYEMVKGAGVSWTDYTFDPTTQEKIDTRVTGRFLAFKVQTITDTHWKVHSFDVEYDTIGKY